MRWYHAPLIALLLAIFAYGPPRPITAQSFGPNVSNQAQYGPPFSTVGGHFIMGGGAAPTINSACGTGAQVPIGTDSSFFFRSGTSTNSGCTVTFAAPWNNPPNCSFDGTNAVTIAIGTSGIVVTGVLDSQTYNVICIGRPGG